MIEILPNKLRKFSGNRLKEEDLKELDIDFNIISVTIQR